jgi:hypothetical protein
MDDKNKACIRFNRLLMGIIMGFLSWLFAVASINNDIEYWYKLASVVMGLLGSGFIIKSIIFDEQ